MEPSIDIIRRTPPCADKIIAYGNSPSQFGELRLPSSSGPHPVVIGIHGGWWRAAHGLETHSHLCAALTRAGFATWNIEYRRIGEKGGGWPGTFHDVGRAIDFLEELKTEYALDLKKLITVGFSAGGQLAAWAALRSQIRPGSTIYSCNPLKIRACVSLAGALDLGMCQKLALSENITKEFMQGTESEEPERYAAASPTSLVASSETDVIFRIFHGTADTSVPHSISEYFFNAAKRNNANCTLDLLPDTHHFELIDPLSSAWNNVYECIKGLRY